MNEKEFLTSEYAYYQEDPEQPPIVLDPETLFIHISLDIPPDDNGQLANNRLGA